jgi:hypothetical protein
VDYVSEESAKAGEGAARFVSSAENADEAYIRMLNGDNVSYTVPQRIRPGRLEGSVKLFFRVRSKLGASVIKVTDASGQELASFKRLSMSPGEMESIFLSKDIFDRAQGDISVSASEA